MQEAVVPDPSSWIQETARMARASFERLHGRARGGG